MKRTIKVLAALGYLILTSIIPALSQEMYKFELMWGSPGTGNGQFNNPVGAAVDSSGNVYVADYGNHRIQKFNPNGDFITQWGSPGDSYFAQSVAVDPSGNVYVVGNETTIKKFDANGNLITVWENSFNDLGSGQIATDSLGNVYATNHYVCYLSACPGPTTRFSIRKFDSNGNLTVEWGESGAGDSQFWSPRGVATDPSGNVYVADTGNHRIQIFDSNGNFISKWGIEGSEEGQSSAPYAISIDSGANVYAFVGNDRIQKYDSTGNFITEWGYWGQAEGQFDGPGGIAVNSLGNAYVADSGNNRIQKFSPVTFADNQWISVGPEGVVIKAIAINPQTPETLYIGTVGFGVLKSIDGGANWIPATNGLTTVNIMALAINPQAPETIYAGTAGFGIFRSIDGGTNWESINNSLPSPAVDAITINPLVPTTVFAGTGGYSGNALYYGDGAFKSIDGGLTWTSVNNGLPVPGGVTALAVNPQTPDTLFAGASMLFFDSVGSLGVLKSSNGGMTWIPTALTARELSFYSYVYALVIDLQKPETVYAGTTGHGVFKSIDGGTTWTTINTGLTDLRVYALAINPQTPNTLYAGTPGGVFRSIDGGTTWVALNAGLPVSAVYALAINPLTPEILYSGTNGFGVFKIQMKAGPTLGVSKPGTGSGTVTSDPPGISCGATCLESYNPGAIVTLTATAESGSTFAGWSGACSGTGMCSVTMDDNKTVVATFNLQLPQYSLTITKSGTGSGTVTSTPPGINCGSTCQANFTTGTNVTLTALADAGSTFTEWSGGGCSGTGPCAINLSSDTTVFTYFVLGNCAYTISPMNKAFTARGGSISIRASATGLANCPVPLVVEDAEWISVSGTPTWKSNKGTVKIAVQGNPSSQSRTGVVSIGSEDLTIGEDGAICQLTALKPSSGKYPNTGGSESFDITVSPQDCRWNVATTFDWIHPDTTTGTGNGTVPFHLDANGIGKNRTGKINVSLDQNTIKKKTFTVNESK
jgi:streptogramin lyase